MPHAAGSVEVLGVQLAPAMWRFDNEDEVVGVLVEAWVPVEEISFDGKCGMVSWPGGHARVGDRVRAVTAGENA